MQSTDNLEGAIRQVYSERDLAGYFAVLQPLILSEVDEVQKITISVILTNITKYSETMRNILQLKKLPSVTYSTVVNGQY